MYFPRFAGDVTDEDRPDHSTIEAVRERGISR